MKMIVCLCYGVSDHAIKKLVKEGACTKEKVQACSGVGTGCGSCLSQLEKIVQETNGARGQEGKLVRIEPKLKTAS